MFFKKEKKEIQELFADLNRKFAILERENLTLRQKLFSLEYEITLIKHPPIYKIGQSIMAFDSSSKDWVVIHNPLIHNTYCEGAYGWKYELVNKITGERKSILLNFDEELSMKNAKTKK